MDPFEQRILEAVDTGAWEKNSGREKEAHAAHSLRHPASPTVRSRSGESAKTGPKGVLADWRARSKCDARQVPSRDRSPPLSDSIGDQSPSDERTTSDDDSDAEKAAVERYRLKRWAELRATHGSNNKVFGHLREIGIDQFESAVVNELSSVTVVLFLYEPHIVACSTLSVHLSSLSRGYPLVKFLKARASELAFALHYADAVLPTLLIYRGGDLVDTLVAVDREWGQRTDVCEADVRDVLLAHHVILRVHNVK